MADDTRDNNEDDWIPIRLREDEEMDFFTELALHEAERWIQAVTRKKFEYPEDFRKSLGNGILLCELLNGLKAGSVKRINKLPGPIAGLDNINVFLTACEKSFGLNKTQLFDATDLEDLSTRAISDESEYLLKQEVDRRARNVAVTIYWLGKTVADKYKGATLDASAFAALVHSHGNKDIISDDSFKNNGSPLTKEDNNVSNSANYRHVRDSSYDSLGSYERESESSFDELDNCGNNMPVRSDMREMRRYGSASSLSMSRDLRLSTASGESTLSDDKHDSLYQSSPDLSQGSHQLHTRTSSTDSAEGSYYGNHSRQSSGGTDYPTRRLSSATRKTSQSTPDPLQFVKLKGADNLAIQAKKQIEATKEVNIMRGKVDATVAEPEPDWQSNFDNWKSKRRKSAYARLSDDLEEEEPEKRQHKTFSQIMAEKDKRRSVGPMHFYPLEDDDSGIGVKVQDSNITKTTNKTNETTPKGKKSEDIAPWAQGSSGEENNSQSDSETNNSHQSGDTDSVFSDKSTPSKILSDDDSLVKKTSAQSLSNKLSGHVRAQNQKQIGDTRKLWENNANESHKKEDKKIRDLPNNSAKIKSLTQSFEQKDKEAHAIPPVTRRSEYNRSSLSKSLDLSDHSYSRPLSTSDKKPTSPLSPTAPKALLPREQRFSQTEKSPQQQQNNSTTQDNTNRKFIEKTIKINQKPNNERGFGFFLAGGVEKRMPITVQRVSLGSAADVCEVEAKDEVLSINGRDVTNLAFAQVQGIVDHSVKRGEIVLKIKRFTDEDGYDSMEDSPVPNNNNNNKSTPTSNNISNNNNSNNRSMDGDKIETQSTRSPYRDFTDSASFKPSLQISARADDPPRLMDQLIEEQKREEAQNKREARARSPVPVETFTADISFNTKYALPPQHEVAPVQQEVTSPVSQPVAPPRTRTSERQQDLNGPDDVTMTEERPTISVKRSTEPQEQTPPKDVSPVVMRRSRQPLQQDSPIPPTPPKSELPQLTKMTESPGTTVNSDSTGFGPPAALMRWQRPRPKSEYQSSFTTTPTEKTFDKNKRLSSTLPYNSESPFSLGKDYSKDDSMMDKVSNDFMESVSVSKPVESSPNSYRFNDSSRIEEWQQKQEQQRMPEVAQSTPTFDVSIRTEDTLTAQEKFERDQQRIRQQFEEEKKRAREAEKLKQEQENRALNSDKFLRDMESQIQQTKQEATNQSPGNNEPIRMSGTEQRYSSEPMTIRLPSNSPRPLVIDPRNQADPMDNNIPEYSFRVDLSKNESAPPLRTLNQPILTPQEILEQERAKIREEEKRKFEEERQKWKEEQEREMRLQQEQIQREKENLLRDQRRIEKEKALLERSKHDDYSYQSSSNNHLYVNPKLSGGLGSSPKSPPALDPMHRKAGPPPTAPKPDKSNKARLTREDLLAMNRKATPLTKPDLTEGGYGSDPLSPTTREAPSKGELHSLNAVPKQKFRSSAAWIKDEEVPNGNQNERPFVIGKRSDLIHTRDNSNPSEHWVVREAEKRRLAEKNNRYNDNDESVTARAGPTKPSQSSLVNRFRGDIEPPARSNRYSYPSANSAESSLSPSSRGSSVNYNRNTEPGVTQFSAKSQPSSYSSNPSLSQTLPPSFSFNANLRNQDMSSTMKPPRSLSDDTGPVIAVSGKQKCSHCGEELGFGAAMVIESLGLYYHVQCFRCCVCRMPLGNGSEGTDVRVRVNKLHCKNCYSNDEAGLKFSHV